jgi:NtrC-family two-component system sensor histidine kinase KinB
MQPQDRILELKKERIDLAQLLKEREVQFAPLMHTENKTIESVISPGVPPVYIERGLIERVLNNLISNAVHHTTSGGRIKLTLDQWGDQVQLSVIDNGQGIPKEYQGKIFEKFVQIERRQARLRTGAGLGLTFCKMVVEAHGGHIRVESDEGKGSAFIFTVPVN